VHYFTLIPAILCAVLNYEMFNPARPPVAHGVYLDHCNVRLASPALACSTESGIVHVRFTGLGLEPSTMSATRLALIALALVALVGPLVVDPAEAESRARCLTRDQQRTAISERRALPLATVRRTLRSKVPGELVRARLCQDPERLIYMLTVLPRDGKVRRVVIDAKDGALLSVR